MKLNVHFTGCGRRVCNERPGLAETAFAAKTKKLTYEQAWEACKKEMDKMGVFGTSTQSNERHTRGAACMQKYGYKI